MGNTVGSRRNLTQREKAVIVGTLLGDGCMEKNGNHVRLRVAHGLRQKEYIEWKFHILKRLATHKPKFVRGAFHQKAGRRYNRLEFSTFSLSELDEYWYEFYGRGKKKVPWNIGELLTSPLSLALWFMDDGYKRSDCNALRISTDSFARNEQVLLQRCLEKNFSVRTTLHRKGAYWNLYIPGAQARKFCAIVQSHIIPSMKYKISLDPVTTVH